MVGPVLAPFGAYELEAPHVVSEILARDEADLHQIDEVPIHGGAVVPLRGELLGDLAVAQRSGGCLEALHHGHARAGATQTRGAQCIGHLGGRSRSACSRSSRGERRLVLGATHHNVQGSARMQMRQRAKALARAIQWSICDVVAIELRIMASSLRPNAPAL